MPKTKLLATVVAAAAVAVTPAAAEAAKPTKYAGKTKEGTKVSFVVAGKKLRDLSTMLPYSCVSAQGGPPTAGLEPWATGYEYTMGPGAAKFTVEEPWPTKHYTIELRGRRGKAITGKLAMNWSMTVPYAGGYYGYRILTCQATGSFKVRPKR